MPAPSTSDEFLELVRKSGVVDNKRLEVYLEKLRASSVLPNEPGKLAGLMVRHGLLTHFQAEQILQGKWRRFTIGKYKVLERLGSGGMGSVYLCEHKLMRRRVAVKVLPTVKANDPASIERFYREARAIAALDHLNIVRAYDIDQDDCLHFLVMEYVDGASLQEIVKCSGPLYAIRAAHYIHQAALGLQHAHEEAGLVHRDIKPGNILVDRVGTVKILDMGLARFFNDIEDGLTKKYDESVLGTADYLAPEQVLDSHGVDIRADIYSLGATFYYCLTGRTPFCEGTIAQKLIWHQTRQPKPIVTIRPDVPAALIAIIEKMMAKDPTQRYQVPQEIADALQLWTSTPVSPPTEAEMPRLSLAAQGNSTGGGMGPVSLPPTPSSSLSPRPRKTWQVPCTPTPKTGLTPPPSTASPSPAPTVVTDVPGVIELASPSQESSSESSIRIPTQPSPARVTVPRPLPKPPPLVTPGTNGQPLAPIASTSVKQIPDDESLVWESVVSDTEDLSAKADTVPCSSQKAPAHQKKNADDLLSVFRVNQRFWLLAALITVALLGSLFLVVLLFLFMPTPVQPALQKTAPTATTFIVNQAKGSGTLKTIQQALERAKPGDKIVVCGRHEEELIFDGKDGRRGKDVVIEPDEHSDHAGEWLLPPQSQTKQIVTLNSVEGLHIRGFKFDGKDRAEQIILMTGFCPGVTLDRLRMQGFRRYAVSFTNCEGASDRSISLLQLQTVVPHGKTADAAISLTANRSFMVRGNRHIRFRNCKFEGSYKESISVDASEAVENVILDDVTIQPDGNEAARPVRFPN